MPQPKTGLCRSQKSDTILTQAQPGTRWLAQDAASYLSWFQCLYVLRAYAQPFALSSTPCDGSPQLLASYVKGRRWNHIVD